MTLTFSLIVNDGSVDSATDTVDITVSNINTAPVADAGAALTDLGSGSYSINITPQSHGSVTMSAAAVAANDMAGSPNDESNTISTNYIDEAFVKTRTQGVIHNLMARRADQITLNDPDLALGLIEQETDAQLIGQGDLKYVQLAFNASLSGESANLARFFGADAAGKISLWTQASFNHVNAETSKSNLGLFFTGVGYRLDKNILVGFMAQYDRPMKKMILKITLLMVKDGWLAPMWSIG